ncbi:beta-lactamase [Diplodia corticola]|uniref:Beta-lactamase n=1 Tax=Diplodia corticola TaxID=236234 RepID=A0A1J9RQ13_9PEZI|nr:beta-lactamase [Diplodia corticola]OJD29645.1 beta-lactamase [Diplodia corticola]
MAAKVQGTCDSRFKKVEELFQSYLDSGEELGASFTVNLDGQEVVDLWGGHADASRTRAWERDTITTVWSTTKCITALAVLVLIDRGLVSPDDPVAKHWPEFGANGKQHVQVRHLLSHTSGVSGWDARLSFDDVCDLPRATALLAAQAPWWEPGNGQSGYHAFTYGHLNGELVRRVTGKSLRAFIAEDLVHAPATPGDGDFQLGCADEALWPRIAETVPPPAMDATVKPPAGVESIAAKTMRSPPPDATAANTAAWRRAELGGANGIGNARGVARLLSAVALAGRPSSSQALLSRETVELVFEEQARGVDLVTGAPMRIGIGLGLAGKDTIANWLPDEGDESRLCFWGGWGGSAGIMDVKRGLTIAYVMNKMENVGFGNDRTKGLVSAVYEALGVEI